MIIGKVILVYIKTRCPQCGVIADMDDAREFQFCRYCGTKINVRASAQSMPVGQAAPAPYSGMPNLIIRYHSTNPSVMMIVRILFSNQVQRFGSGQSFSFYMPYGTHRITLQIGRKNYARDIYLPDTNAPVTIYASWNGRAHIEISNPPYVPPVQQIVYVPVQAPAPAAVCAKCGRSLREDDVFCPGCGTKKPNS